MAESIRPLCLGGVLGSDMKKDKVKNKIGDINCVRLGTRKFSLISCEVDWIKVQAMGIPTLIGLTLLFALRFFPPMSKLQSEF